MPRTVSRFMVTVMATLLATGWLTARPQAAAAVSPDVVISQVYGAGGNAGPATYQSDFIELYNRGASMVNLATYSVQYAATTGTTWQRTNLTGFIGAGQHYLVKEATGAGCLGLPCGTPLPGADATGTISMAAGAGKVALLSSQTTVTSGTSCPSTNVVDLVGYGTGTNCFEGAGPTGTISATTAALRAADGATDTDSNSADFTVGAPNPRSTGVIWLSINDVSHNESSGSQLYSFTVTVSPAAPAGGVTFDIATADNTATTADGDYFGDSLVGQSIPEGSKTFVFSVVANGDDVFEPDETFFVNVTNVVGATVADAQGVGTLVNDDVSANNCGDPYTAIYQIQGSGASAATTGDVSTEGVVVGDFEGSAAASGFYIQDPTGDANPATSDGIFVFTGSANLASVGDHVRVSGFARERFNQTTINGANDNASPVTSVLVCSTGNPLPAATQVLLPVTAIGDFEKFEGMLVNFGQQLVVSEYFNYGRFGEIVLALPLAGESRPYTGTAIDEPGPAANARNLANSLSRITLDDAQAAQNPEVLRHPNGSPFTLANLFRGGDTVQNATGVLGFDFSLYRIIPTAAATYTPANPRPAPLHDVGGRLKVAAMNTLNYFLTLDTTASDTGSGPCGANQNLDCRGADSDQPNEFSRQRDKLLQALSSLNADVLGLNELENTPGVDPTGDLVAGLNLMLGAGTYATIATGTIGTDAIKVGLLYKPGMVTPVGAYQILDSTDDARFIDTKSRPSLAQTFMENSTGELFTVVVNHFKSKGSDCIDVGDPDLGDGQGNCSQTRRAAAEALVDWIATDPTGSGDPDFLIVGDLNSYAKEDSIDEILQGSDDVDGSTDDWTNLIAKYLGTYAYSYVFDGMAGYLDHALSSATMTGQVTGAAEWHINADEPSVLDYDTSFKGPGQVALYEVNQYRTSDHDPVLVGLNLFGLPTTVTVNGGDDQSTTVDTDFPTQLDLTVTDSEGNPVAGVPVTFTAPVSGASASIVEAGPYLTDAGGNLLVTAHANAVAGGPYDLSATAGTGSATFHLTNVAGAADHITINAGDNQSATIDTDFATQLDLTVFDAENNPVPNTTVTFDGPLSGGSASIVEAGPYTTDANGNLVVTAHANTTAGSYNLVASSSSATATFHLTNLVGAPASITVNAGDNQSATVNTDFATQLNLTVLDAGGNMVPNATVTFAGPLSGASASIVAVGPYLTDASGNLVVTAHANATAGGPYAFVATAGSASATFHLTNLPAPLAMAQLSSASSCPDFVAGTAPTLTEITYTVNKGKINTLGVSGFSYWVKVNAAAGGNSFTIEQSITSGNFATLIALAPSSAVYRSDCSAGVHPDFAQSSINGTSGTVTVTFTAPAAGAYYINVKFSSNSVKGVTAPTPTTVHYVFSTTGLAGSTRGLDLRKP